MICFILLWICTVSATISETKIARQKGNKLEMLIEAAKIIEKMSLASSRSHSIPISPIRNMNDNGSRDAENHSMVHSHQYPKFMYIDHSKMDRNFAKGHSRHRYIQHGNFLNNHLSIPRANDILTRTVHRYVTQPGNQYQHRPSDSDGSILSRADDALTNTINQYVNQFSTARSRETTKRGEEYY